MPKPPAIAAESSAPVMITEWSIQELMKPECFPHEVESLELLETHISWVILTGPYAYKIKKPVNPGFLDFTSLERRRFYCFEEVRLNQRLAPDVYLGVETVIKVGQGLHIGGNGEVMDYAVKMVQFPPHRLLSELLEENQLGSDPIEKLADHIASFHVSLSAVHGGSELGGPEAVYAPIADNFRRLLPSANQQQESQLKELLSWSQRQYRKLMPLLSQRRDQGFVRECHGDMHLGNITLVDDKIVIFDGIEFSKELSTIDIMSEIAFLLVDLHMQGRRDLASTFLNRYLSKTGDYDGLAVLRFYEVYRALVRAKVISIRITQTADDQIARAELKSLFQRYLDVAQSLTAAPTPRLLITHGLSGSGKTWISNRVACMVGAIHIRSDIERKRLLGIDNPDATSCGGEAYNGETTRLTYARLWNLAETLLRSGQTVIVDATFGQWERREAFRRLASVLRVPFAVLEVETPEPLMKQRVESRQKTGNDASDATLQVLAEQIHAQQGLSSAEQENTIRIHGAHPDLATLATKIENLRRRVVL